MVFIIGIAVNYLKSVEYRILISFSFVPETSWGKTCIFERNGKML